MFGMKARRAACERLQRLELTLEEYERWFSIYPDIRHMFRAMLHQAAGGAMNAGTVLGAEPCTVRGTREQVERMRAIMAPQACAPGLCLKLTPAEIQSKFDRVRWAEGLIRQLPETHDGRNGWLLNYGAVPTK